MGVIFVHVGCFRGLTFQLLWVALQLKIIAAKPTIGEHSSHITGAVIELIEDCKKGHVGHTQRTLVQRFTEESGNRVSIRKVEYEPVQTNSTTPTTFHHGINT